MNVWGMRTVTTLLGDSSSTPGRELIQGRCKTIPLCILVKVMSAAASRKVSLLDGMIVLAAVIVAAGAQGAQRAPATTQATTAPITKPTDPDLFAWWRADRAAAGEIPNLKSTRTAAKPIAGKVTVETVADHPAIRIGKDARELSAGTDGGFDFSADFTVTLRVKLAADTGDVTLLSKRGANGADGWAIVHGITGFGGITFVAAPRVVVPTPCKATEDWVHVAVTFHEKEFLLYIDGKAIGIRELPGVPPASNEPLIFGADAGGKHAMDGWLDDIRIYHRGLTAAEVETLADGKEPANPYTPLSAAEEKDVRAKIAELGGDSYASREKAAAALKAMGRKIYPILREYRDADDLEVGLRVKAILGELPRAEEEK
jgi:hypothetical protein